MAPRFLSPYYLANAACIASYALLRRSAQFDGTGGGVQRLASAAELRTWELQCSVAFTAVAIYKVWRRRSPDGAAAQLLFYAKLLLAVTVAMINPWLLPWYCAAFWAIYVLLPQPMVDFGGAVAMLNPTTLREAAMASDCTWLVFFFTYQHSASVAAAPAFLSVATEFASPKLKFGAIDVLSWPAGAADMRMTTNTWSSQLPAVVMYEKGRGEWGRLPPAEAATDASKRNNYTRADIVRLFKLEERFPRPLDVPTPGGSTKQSDSKAQ